MTEPTRIAENDRRSCGEVHPHHDVYHPEGHPAPDAETDQQGTHWFGCWEVHPECRAWRCTDLCDHEASVYQCERIDGDPCEVRPLMSQWGDSGYGIFDKVAGRFVGGWHLYEQAAEMDAQAQNRAFEAQQSDGSDDA